MFDQIYPRPNPIINFSGWDLIRYGPNPTRPDPRDPLGRNCEYDPT